MSEPQPPTTIFGLLRHGQTVWNKEKRIQGSTNSALTSEGAASCRNWGQFLSTSQTAWQRIIVSPLQRARDTAQLVNEALQIPIEHDDEIREQHWGDWEGLTLEQIRTDSPGKLQELTQLGWDFRPPGGESRRELLQRVLASLKKNSARWPRENLLIISHLGVIKSLLYYTEGRDYLPQEPKIVYKNHFHTLGYQGSALSIIRRNISLPDVP
jgi:broad specificity phosphatase PhoE